MIQKYTLIKMSAPGWQKDFSNLYSLLEELKKHICSDCLNGSNVAVCSFDDETGEIREEYVYKEDAPNPNSVISLLATSCGVEFDVIWPNQQEDFEQETEQHKDWT